ncbi:uncharacterized protein DUF3347 [Gillisia sp. Hel_I_86]|uniref:DUF3347 domain-containing protein n=1 Tax=Gillisia sp. Hel_I_86 TaxID=1249981 RepID=UPI00119B7743|nr:DUF3347 domain-containing protein [Gillisia sp. Hel_I_86]TVZ26843.1 uncharacterized protein DUF3347 [Gillisia sp. Hel_I_86]
MKKTMIMLCLAFVSLGSYAQHNHGSHEEGEETMGKEPMFKDKVMGTVYGHYLNLKEALVASSKEDAAKASAELQNSLGFVKNSKTVQLQAEKVTTAVSLEDQRKAFTKLSSEMATLIKDGALAMGEIYLEFCPMANENTGGYWLSNEKEIQNPYLGQNMLKCGSIKEKIN